MIFPNIKMNADRTYEKEIFYVYDALIISFTADFYIKLLLTFMSTLSHLNSTAILRSTVQYMYSTEKRSTHNYERL
jgi:hypothetical protein